MVWKKCRWCLGISARQRDFGWKSLCTCALIIIFLCSKVLRSLIKREIFISWNRAKVTTTRKRFFSSKPNWATTLTTTTATTTLTTFNFRPKRVYRWMISPLFFPLLPSLFFPTSWFNFFYSPFFAGFSKMEVLLLLLRWHKRLFCSIKYSRDHYFNVKKRILNEFARSN